jgi:hypothetical protein
MIYPAETLSAQETEEMLLAQSITMPDGYTGLGLAMTPIGPTLFITAEGMPAMVWRNAQWERCVPVEIHG